MTGSELIAPAMFEGELRVHDVLLGNRLDYAKPVDIRKLIGRWEVELARMGTVATEATVNRGQKATEYYLNRRQAIFITAKSDKPEATDITIEIIERFDAYEHGDASLALTGQFQKLTAEMTAFREEMRLLRGGHDQTQGIVEAYRPMLKIVERFDVEIRGRRTLIRQCSNLLRRWCAHNNKGNAVQTCKVTGRYLFHIDAVDLWLSAHGKAIIRAHKDRVKGQGALRLVPPPSARLRASGMAQLKHADALEADGASPRGPA